MSKFEEMMEEFEELKESRELLEAVWSWHGPYGPRVLMPNGASQTTMNAVFDVHSKMAMPQELRLRLQGHFDFDDSE